MNEKQDIEKHAKTKTKKTTNHENDQVDNL